MIRTHYCGEPDIALLDKEVTLTGWVDSRRDHGGLIFIDLRDRTGKVQVVVDPKAAPEAHKISQDIRSEFVLKVKGKVRRRPEGTINKNIKTGEIEVSTTELTVLNPSKALPFQIDDTNVAEEVRLKYRYLDIRRPKMLSNIINRHKVTFISRDYLDKLGFPGNRDAFAYKEHSGRRKGFPGAKQAVCRRVLRASAVTADAETDNDGLRD